MNKITNLIIMCFLLLFSIIMFGTKIFAVDISSCQNLGTGNYNVTSNLQSNGTNCLNITGVNVILDCQNNNITGNSTENGIYISANSAIIRNCNIYNFTRGIYGLGSSNNRIKSVTTNNNLYGIEMDTSHDNNFSSIVIKYNTYGLRLDESDRNNISSINISDNGYGLYTYHVDYNNFTNIIAKDNTYGNLMSFNYYNNIQDSKFNSFAYSFNNFQCSNTLKNVSDENNRYHHIFNNQNGIVLDGLNNVSSIMFCNTNTSEVKNMEVVGFGAGNFIYSTFSNGNVFENLTLSNFSTPVSLQDTHRSNFTNIITNYNNVGFDISASDYNNFNYVTVRFNTGDGISQTWSDYNNYTNIAVTNNGAHGINYVFYSRYNIIKNSNISVNVQNNLNYIDSIGTANGNIIYNNTLGNISKISTNNWNDWRLTLNYSGVGNIYFNESGQGN
ncbi:MAG: right-handed parallel beta-helix repeat-containing protein, partial [Nanoarchaeota archaeon]|nr:right-handed parallel beta-helix repeat-containing protein [Nanoarchaeota archaeon]